MAKTLTNKVERRSSNDYPRKDTQMLQMGQYIHLRLDIQEYLNSIGHIHRPKRHIKDVHAKNLSLSENSGYNYIPIR